jgi:hypothetical protein
VGGLYSGIVAVEVEESLGSPYERLKIIVNSPVLPAFGKMKRELEIYHELTIEGVFSQAQPF